MNDKKKFVKPEAEFVEFNDEDIITESLGVENAFDWDNGGIRETL